MNSEAALMFLTAMLMTIQELWDVVQMVEELRAFRNVGRPAQDPRAP